MYQGNLLPSPFSPVISLPRMDLDIKTVDVLGKILSDRNQLQIARQLINFGINRCPFAESGSLAIRWDGEISPCLPLLHTHENYPAENHRVSYAYSFGNVNEDNLKKYGKKKNIGNSENAYSISIFHPVLSATAVIWQNLIWKIALAIRNQHAEVVSGLWDSFNVRNKVFL